MIRLTSQRIDIAELLAAVADPEHGGTVLFVGTSRRDAAARPVRALGFEAYEELAISEIEGLARDAADRHAATVAAVHRLGAVPVGEAAVVVAASSRGRDGAFAACRETIDALKARAPIWKQCMFEDGGAAWSRGA